MYHLQWTWKGCVESTTGMLSNWQAFLKVDENKTELFEFLAEQSMTLGNGRHIILTKSNAGINLTGYHPPGTLGLLHQNVCPAPEVLHNRKCPGARPINGDVSGPRHLYQLASKHENCQHSYLSLKIKMSECPTGPGKVQKTENAISTCFFALSP